METDESHDEGAIDIVFTLHEGYLGADATSIDTLFFFFFVYDS